MEKVALTISLPRTMKQFIEHKVQQGRFSTPSEYIRSLIRHDEQQENQRCLEAFVRKEFDGKELSQLKITDWAAVEDRVLKRSRAKRVRKQA
jgi:antitoxin ParD1/3/4